MASKLSFHVVGASSEADDHPATELNYHGPHTKGWMSASFCTFPQELILQFDDGVVTVNQIQILSHQSNIATKIELYTGTGKTPDSAKWRRLGYLSLDSNERSGYKARELKSVYVEASGNYMKLSMGHCYINSHNLLNQVGVVAISILGVPGAGAAAAAAAAPAVAAAASSSRHGRHASSGAAGGAAGASDDDLAVDFTLDPETVAKLREVHRLKEAAVAREEYDKAKQYKVIEDNIKRMGSKLAKLHADKVAAVRSEDYDLAKRLKDEIDHIRRTLIEPPGQAPAQPQYNRGPPQQAAAAPAPAPGYGGGGYTPRSVQQQQRHQQPPHHQQHHEPAPRSARNDYGHDGPGYGGGGGGGGPAYQQNPEEAPIHQHPRSPTHRGGASGDYGEPAPYGSAGGQDPYGAEPAMAAAPAPAPAAPSNPMEMPLPGNRGQNIYEAAGGDPDAIPPGSRPQSRAIKPSGQGAGGFDIDDDAAAFGGAPGGAPVAAPSTTADAAALAGVPDVDSLPAPDAMSEGKAKELSDVAEVVGQYVVRCFCSKAWALREAALLKVQLELQNYPQPPAVVLTAVAHLLQLCATKEKIAQVFLTSMGVLRSTFVLCEQLRRGEVLGVIETLTSALVDKLGDNNARCREAANDSLIDMAHQQHIGANFVGAMTLRKLKKRQANAWRPLKTRLELLRTLVELFGLDGTGMSSDALIKFTVDTKSFDHSKGEVRTAAMDLVVELFKAEGPSIRGKLGHLRKKQLEEYEAQFSGGGSDTAARAAEAAARRASAHKARESAPAAAPRKKSAAPPANGGGAGGGAGVQSTPRSDSKDAGMEEEDEPEEDETECQFCAWPYPPDITEQKLDLHYWQSCPVLMQCPGCQQVLEISMLTDHLQGECVEAGNFGPCDRCGEAIPKDDLDAHLAAQSCEPAKPLEEANRCPLCHLDIAPGPDGWGSHLLDTGCPKNPRPRVSH